MKFLCFASLLATAAAFTTAPSSFSAATVGERAIGNVFADSNTHRTRRATIVMDGKANGKIYVNSVLLVVRTSSERKHVLHKFCASITLTMIQIQR